MSKVKALSFRQPWAELVIQGSKTLDLRTWSTAYRGPLAVYASNTVEEEASRAHGLDPGRLTTGAVVGLVDLVRIVRLDEPAYRARQEEHLGGRAFRDKLYGWELANPRPLAEPVPARGRLRLFEVALPDGAKEAEQQAAAPREAALLPANWEGKPFELRVVPEEARQTGGAQPPYRLALYQRLVEPPAAQRTLYRQAPPSMERVVELGGAALRGVADQVLEALRANDYKAVELSAGRREPFVLAEESGVRLGLVFLAVKPLTKMERVEAISQGIRAMTSEELYYWYSKCTAGPAAERAQKALRVLLAAE
jgi:hypothetical protein